jgi:hypothetical protein
LSGILAADLAVLERKKIEQREERERRMGRKLV